MYRSPRSSSAAHRARAKSRPSRFEQLERRELLATLVWVGDASANWNDNLGGNTNWDRTDVATPNVLPTAGDTLVFPATAGNKTNVNDTATGTSYILSFTGSAYAISGNRISLSGAALTDTLGGNALTTPLTLAADAT